MSQFGEVWGVLRRDLPLRWMVPLAILVVGGLLLTGYTVIEAVEDRGEVEAEARRRVAERLTATASDVEAALRRRDGAQVSRSVALLRNMQDLEVAVLVDARGVVVAATTFSMQGKPIVETELAPYASWVEPVGGGPRPFVRRSDRGDRLVAVTPVLQTDFASSSTQGALLVELDLARVRAAAFRESLRDAGLMASLLGMVSLLVWWLLHRRLTRHMDRLVSMADEIAAGRLSARSGLEGNSELSRIGRAMDAMAFRLSRDREALRSSEQRFRQLIEQGSDLILALDDRYRIIFASPSLSSVLGREPDSILGLECVELLETEEVETVRESLSRASSEPGRVETVECSVQHSDGSWRILEAAVRAPGDVAEWTLILSARDVTNRRRLESDLLQARKMEAVGRLAGGVAHDFNNMLTVILGRLDLILHRGLSDERMRSDLEVIRTAAGRASEVTQQLLAFGRKQTLRLELVEVNELCKETAQLLDRLLGETVELVCNLEGDLPPVQVDPGQLREVLMNLCLNARDAMPDGGRLAISTRWNRQPDTRSGEAPRGGWVVLAVADEGEGMEPEVVERMFEPFYTTKDVGEGSGLGLAAVHGVIEQSGGRVAVDSAPGRGTEVSIYLPAAGHSAPPEDDDVASRAMAG